MPQDKLEQVLLAREVLNNSLGGPGVPAKLHVSKENFDHGTWAMPLVNPKIPSTTTPDIVERKIPTGLQAKGRLFKSPFPDPVSEVETPEILAALKLMKQDHPQAFNTIQWGSFEPHDSIGHYYTGSRGFIVDPKQAVESKWTSSTNPIYKLLDAIKHEIGHGLNYPDNYGEQPVLRLDGGEVYGRRPLAKDGKPRDAQDIDLASAIVNRNRK